ncbi:MAG: hypothetical protein FalmKO_28110 [Falsiruegeria mediterranea]
MPQGSIEKEMFMEPNRPNVPHNVHQLRVNSMGRQMTHGPARIDCETASLLRAILLPLFASATSWTDLIDKLEAKGFHPMFRTGQLCLTKQSDGSRICGLRFLGLDIYELVLRFGRPCVMPHSGSSADGEILRQPPNGPLLH